MLLLIEQKTKYHFDVMYFDIEKIIFVVDNLNTHKAASLYEQYLATETREIIKHVHLADHYLARGNLDI